MRLKCIVTYVTLLPGRTGLPHPVRPPPPSQSGTGHGKFHIHFPYMDGVATLRSEKEGSQLTLEPWQGENNQTWRFDSL